jgi:hypothetical protein
MKIVEPTLKERTGLVYRRLLLLQHLFHVAIDADETDWLEKSDKHQNDALCAGIREMLDELTEHARVMTTIPMPIGEWRPGDGPADERWRPLTELERREVLALLIAYENLVSWSEESASHANAEPSEYLKAERAKIERFRREMTFLDKRRNVAAAPPEPFRARV